MILYGRGSVGLGVIGSKLRVRVKVKEPGPYMSRADMYEVLLSKRGKVCEEL